MALFKISRGASANLPVEKHDGWAYFCTDTAEFFIDYLDENEVLQRKPLNADAASKLIGYDITNALVYGSEVEIPTTKAVMDKLADMVNVADIVNNLTTSVANKPLSAAQGVAIKSLIDALQTVVNGKVDSTSLNNYYTKSETDSLELISVADIHAICGSTTNVQIVTLNEGVF